MNLILLFLLFSIEDSQSSSRNFFVNYDERLTEEFSTTTTFNSFTLFSLLSSIKEEDTSMFSTIDYSTITNENDEWINVNQSKIFWKKVQGSSLSSLKYELKSDGECIREMCFVKLEYQKRLMNEGDGCLTFLVLTNGQPVGQIWIEQDDQEDSFSQIIQLTNSTLFVQHSFKPNLKHLSINSRILFPNSLVDRIMISNLTIDFNGPCPTNQTKIPFDRNEFFEESTIENPSSEYSQMTSESKEEILIITSTEMPVNSSKWKNSFINESNVLSIILLIIFFCLLMIISSLIYGFWITASHYRSIWYVPYEHPIQFICRRSIHSSDHRLETLEDISNDITIDELTMNTSQSNLSDLHSYF